MNLETEVSQMGYERLLETTDTEGWTAFADLLKAYVEIRRDKLEKRDDPEVRGELKMLRKLLRLRDDLLTGQPDALQVRTEG